MTEMLLKDRTPRTIECIAVYCGSNFGAGDRYRDAAAALGHALATEGLTLVYGGTHKGLMGVLADAALSAGGKVHGVINRRLHERGHLHPSLSAHEIVDSMSLRKARMLSLADACIALPGGLGTVEEFMEAWTLNQLGDVDKPVGLFNVGGYYEPLLTFIDRMVEQRFLPPEHRRSIVVQSDVDGLIEGLRQSSAVVVPKWL